MAHGSLRRDDGEADATSTKPGLARISSAPERRFKSSWADDEVVLKTVAYTLCPVLPMPISLAFAWEAARGKLFCLSIPCSLILCRHVHEVCQCRS